MKQRLWIALVALGMQIGSYAFSEKAEAGLLGVGIFGSGAIVSQDQKAKLWLFTAASAGVVYGGVKLIQTKTTLGIIGGIVVLILDHDNQISAENLENYFLFAYPEIDDREWLAEVARVAQANSRLLPVSHPQAIPGSKIIDVRLSAAQFEALVEETSLSPGQVARLRADLL